MKVNNGNFRKKKLTVDLKDAGGQSLPTYPRSFFITASFEIGSTTHPSLTDTEFAEMDEAEYQSRLEDFLLYIESEIQGLDTEDYQYEPGEEPNGVDTDLCPIGV